MRFDYHQLPYVVGHPSQSFLAHGFRCCSVQISSNKRTTLTPYIPSLSNIVVSTSILVVHFAGQTKFLHHQHWYLAQKQVNFLYFGLFIIEVKSHLRALSRPLRKGKCFLFQICSFPAFQMAQKRELQFCQSIIIIIFKKRC